MSDLRSKFEEIPEISFILSKPKQVLFNEENNMYTGGIEDYYYWINGAWFAFQEQQKKINAVIKWVEDKKKTIPLSEWHGYTTEEYVDADDLLEILND